MSISQLEFNISLIAEFLRKGLGLSKKLQNHSKQSFLNLSKNYFKNDAGIVFEWGASQEWNNICGHFKIRNVIAHNGGIVSLSEKQADLESFVENYDDDIISIENDCLMLSYDYVIEVVQDSQGWLKELFSSLESHTGLKNKNWV